MRFSDEQKQELIDLLTQVDKKLTNINEQFTKATDKIGDIVCKNK